jgi:hypothetical protein
MLDPLAREGGEGMQSNSRNSFRFNDKAKLSQISSTTNQTLESYVYKFSHLLSKH